MDLLNEPAYFGPPQAGQRLQEFPSSGVCFLVLHRRPSESEVLEANQSVSDVPEMSNYDEGLQLLQR